MRIAPLLVSFVLLAPCCLLGDGMIAGVWVPKNEWDFFPKDKIRMEVALDREFTSFEAQWVGFNFPVYCRWTNIGKKSVRLLLKEHDSYHGTLDYPWGVEVRLTDESGKVHTGGEGGWGSRADWMSDFSEVESRDSIVLKPGAAVIRTFPLIEVIGGSWRPLDGAFRAELRLGGIQATKPLTLRLGREYLHSGQISMEAAFDSAFTKHEDKWVGLDVPLFCRWTNTGTEPATILLHDQDYQGRNLDFPCGLEVRLTKEGDDAVAAEPGLAAWVSPSLGAEWRDADRRSLVTLPPGGSVVRKVRLAALLEAKWKRKAIRATYTIETRFGALQPAAKLTLRVAPEFWQGEALETAH